VPVVKVFMWAVFVLSAALLIWLVTGFIWRDSGQH
jgi:hypothetical protein